MWMRTRLASRLTTGRRRRRRITAIWRYWMRTLMGRMTMKKKTGPRRTRRKCPITLALSRE